ncbi:hypothetical protein S14_79 [Shewanella sp. phage 1/4]|nr:hypothetical protein S14_79 [Shewanella sp. phage 1/4]AHK11191.1 hypothetical protein S14_79 [Shewanella sp. phage 1/4]
MNYIRRCNMFKLLKVWWYYSVLSKVLLDENGNPYDRKGMKHLRV